jgi:hypothetical protein
VRDDDHEEPGEAEQNRKGDEPHAEEEVPSAMMRAVHV